MAAWVGTCIFSSGRSSACSSKRTRWLAPRGRSARWWLPACRLAFYLSKMNSRVVDDLVVNIIDVGEETAELDTILYKVADIFDEEVTTLTDGLMKLIEPLLIVFLGGAVGLIVSALFLPRG